MSEDLDLIRNWLGCELQGMLDLQMAMALAGAGHSVGYARAVETMLGKSWIRAKPVPTGCNVL